VDYGGLTSTYAAAPTGTTANCTNTSGTNSNISKAYYTDLGVLASSTKNVYGIYDVSGGASENVMAVYSDSSDRPMSGNFCSNHSINYNFSGFNGACNNSTPNPSTAGINYPDSKYYNLYRENVFIYSNAQRCTFATCGGHALHEVWTGTGDSGTSYDRHWNGDSAYFILSLSPLFARGGNLNIGVLAGVWSLSDATGAALGSVGFRPLMSIF
jgi:hypothetical protein